MMLDRNKYHKEIGARLGELMKLSPDMVRGHRMPNGEFLVPMRFEGKPEGMTNSGRCCGRCSFFFADSKDLAEGRVDFHVAAPPTKAFAGGVMRIHYTIESA